MMATWCEKGLLSFAKAGFLRGLRTCGRCMAQAGYLLENLRVSL